MMDDCKCLSKHQYCFGCLRLHDRTSLKCYKLKLGVLKNILQVDCINLCYLCKKKAKNAELFIQNVQSNQLFLQEMKNFSDTMIEERKIQTRPVIKPNKKSSVNDCPIVVHEKSSDKDTIIKDEMKEEKNDSSNYVEMEVIEQENDTVKDEVQIENVCVQKEANVKNHVDSDENDKLIDEVTDDIPSKCVYNIEAFTITKEQCLEERERKAKEINFINSLYKCMDCILGFKFKPSYDLHMESHSKASGVYECEICKKRIKSKRQMRSHEIVHKVRYKCGECGLVRSNRNTLEDHYSKLHATEENENFVCHLCPQAYKTKSLLRKHLSRHKLNTRAICAYCNKSYVNKDVLKHHMITMHPKEVSGVQEKNFKCEECGMAFKFPFQLKRHSVKHSTAKDFYCVQCDKSFKSNISLKQHLKTTIHVESSDLPFSCSHCDKRFGSRRSLKNHINRVHLNVKPFQCDRCDKAYLDSFTLSRHKQVIHEGYKRPLRFPCTICDKAFSSNQTLKCHVRTHTGERPYQCSTCTAKFTHSSSLNLHVKLIHLKLTRDGKPKATLK